MLIMKRKKIKIVAIKRLYTIVSYGNINTPSIVHLMFTKENCHIFCTTTIQYRKFIDNISRSCMLTISHLGT